MMNPNLKKNLCGLAVALALGVAPLGVAQAQTGAANVPCPMMGYGSGAGMGPGMMGMGGMGGMGMMGGGMMDMMMGGGGMGGMGMMGGGMMGGPGMMGGGYGMGPGMMGGDTGMMGMGPVGMLNLSDDQRDKIEKIYDDERKKHWDVAGKMMEEQNRLRDLYQTDEPDPKKVGAVYGNIAKLRQQMVETHIQARNQIQALLTKEQREQLRQWRRGGWGPGYGPRNMPGPGGGMGPGMMGPGMMGR